jgi:superfamily II DNA or RNA helicase
MEKLFTLTREMAEPSVWSAGVELARNGIFTEDFSSDPDERSFRIAQGRRDLVIVVSLSESNELWQCSCKGEDDPCKHVIAAVIAVKQGKLSRPEKRTSIAGGSAEVGVITHEFTRRGTSLEFLRYISFGTNDKVEVVGTLIQAIASEERAGKRLFPTEDELRVDYALPTRRSGLLDPKTMRHLIPTLSRVSCVLLDGERVSVSSEPLMVRAEVVDEADGYRLRRIKDAQTLEYFDNSAALVDGKLHAVEDSALRIEELELLKADGSFFSKDRAVELATVVLPRLQGKIDVRVVTRKLPRARRIAPRVVIEALAVNDGAAMAIIPRIVYGNPIIARVRDGQLILEDQREIPVREPAEEGRLIREVSLKLGFRVDQVSTVAGERAFDLFEKLKGWSIEGDAARVFRPRAVLVPRAVIVGDSLSITFKIGEADHQISEVDARDVLSAWGKGSSYVRLSDGSGWAILPKEWLAEHSVALERMLAARENSESEAHAKIFSEVEQLCESVGIEPPEYFTRLKRALAEVESIPDATLPKDLSADLRPYQRVGVNWLSFLLEHGLGALLADDMGLGKTLQTLCVVDTKTLVVCPTSVLGSWREQIERFRPALKTSVYHGSNRELEQEADITITSYALLRRDIDLLSEVNWGLVVLDEAQTIRNPESQVARAAHRINAPKRISLSGTPIENSLDDLWSQFRFLNPGLLVSYSEFQTFFAEPIINGDLKKSAELRKRVMPFVLRRMKRDVAKDLPPKTEVVLDCELSHSERVVYDAVLTAARAEIESLKEEGKGVFSALEALLRLRQASCHLALLPGYSDVTSSAKLDLLIDSLERSKAQGHRALVFSQWTSMLDLLEPRLRDLNLSFFRIDGATTDRADLVTRFQRDDGPDLMLLSLKAGGLGLTLTAADHVYILDPWWNPAAEDQAADRAYRIGQVNPVIVHRLVAKDTVEERILKIQHEKRSLLTAALGGDGALNLSMEELASLLE